MQNVFIAIYNFLKANKIRFFGISLAVLIGLYYFASQIAFQENITELIPSSDKSNTTSKVLKQVNFADKISVVIERKSNGTPDDLTTFASEFIDSLQLHCQPFIGKIQGKLDEKNIQETFDFVYQNWPLFLDQKDYQLIESKLNNDSIARLVESNYRSLISPTGIVSKDFILKDPMGISFIALKKLQQLSVGDDFKLQNGFLLTKDQNNVLLFITPKLPANETDQNTVFIEKINQIKDNLNKKYHKKASLSYFGATPVAVANATQIKADVRNTSIFATLSLILLLVYFYRSLSIPLLIFIPSVFGAVFSLMIMYFTKGTISAISLGISSILLGETTDYSIYVLTHLRDNKNVKLLYKDITRPLILCGITTSVTFLCLFFIDSQALKDLGIFAALSVTSTTIFSLILIPLLYTNTNQLKIPQSNVIDRLGSYSYHKNKFLISGVLLVFIGSFFTYKKVTFNNDLAALNFVPKEIQNAQDKLEELADGDTKSIYLATYGNSYDEVIRNNNSLFSRLQQEKVNGQVANFSSIGGILLDKKQQLQKIKDWNAFWTQNRKDFVRNAIVSKGTQLGFNSDAYASFYQMLDHSFQTIEFEEYAKVKSLFTEEFVARKSNFYTISTLVKVPKEKRDHFVLSLENEPNLVVIDRQKTNETFLGMLKDNFESLVNYSFIAVFLILLISFRRIELVIVSIIPIMMSWIFTLGVMGMFGLEFNIINIIVCTLIFGIGVDYSIFMTTALQKQHTFGKIELPSYRTSILLSLATTILGIGVLIFAQHPALKSIALIALIGIFAAVLITFVIQPLVFGFFVTNNVKKGNPPFEIRRFIHSVLSFTYYGLGGFILSLVGSFFVKFFPLNPAKKLQIFHSVLSKFMHSVFWTYPAIKRKIVNTTNEKFDKPAVIIANHTSFLDILAVGMLSPKIIFLVSDWVYNSPVFGKGVRLAGFYPVSNGIDNGVEHLREKVNQGFSLMVFPEGTRSVDNSVKRFHKGAFYLAEEFNLDVIPVVIHGYSEASPKGDFMLYGSSTTVEILERIAPNDVLYGLNYTEKTKKINRFFREQFDRLRYQKENAMYFKRALFNSFAYKESEVLQAVKEDFAQYHDLYFRLNQCIGAKSKMLHFSADFGQLDILLALYESTRKIDSYNANEDQRSCAKTNHYLKKRTINYLDNVAKLDVSKYEFILISDPNFSTEIATFTGTVIVIKHESVKDSLVQKGFHLEKEQELLFILKK